MRNLFIYISIFISFLSVNAPSSLAHAIELELCTDETLGYQIKCNPNWMKIPTEDGGVLIMIENAPELLVTSTINRANEPIMDFDYVVNAYTAQLQSAEAPSERAEKLQINNYEVLKIESTNADPGNAHTIQYYIKRENDIYAVTFAISPKSKFPNYQQIFEEIIHSFKFL